MHTKRIGLRQRETDIRRCRPPVRDCIDEKELANYDFAHFRTLTADNHLSGLRIAYAETLKVEVLYRSVLVGDNFVKAGGIVLSDGDNSGNKKAGI